jgi:hypothetical protein
MIHKIRYEDLINKFNLLQKKVNEDKLKDYIRDAEMQKTTKNIETNMGELQEFEMYILFILVRLRRLRMRMRS